MGAPYSEDLRLRVLAALDGGMSKMAAHKLFCISRSTLDDWLILRAQQGSVVANTRYRRGILPKITDLEALGRFAQAHSGCTLKQLAHAWQEETGQSISSVTMGKALSRTVWTHKKRAGSTENATLTSELSSAPT